MIMPVPTEKLLAAAGDALRLKSPHGGRALGAWSAQRRKDTDRQARMARLQAHLHKLARELCEN